MRLVIVLATMSACGFGPAPAKSGDDTTPDAPLPPITCGDLTCDPHAVCDASGPTCSCQSGFTGNGFVCTDVNECATSNGGCAAACVNHAGTFECYAPKTCAEVAAKIPNGGVGDTRLFIGGDAAKPWTAFCASGKEYLTLPTGGTNNYSQYTKSPTSVRTSYTKIRLDPAALLVDNSDETYSTSTGSLYQNPDTVTSMPYGVAMDCEGSNSNSGIAKIDLSNTPFAINDPFQGAGFNPGGGVVKSNMNRTVTVSGGGYCGYWGPSPVPYNPYNTTGGPILDVVYQP